MGRTAAAILFSALAAGPLVARAAEPPQGPVFNIMGRSTCAGWPKTGRLESAGKAVPLNWVLGFASGEAEADLRLLDLLQPETVDAWIGAYCQAHPTESLPAASRAMVAELKAKLPPLAPTEPPMFVPSAAAPPAAKPPPARRPAARRSGARR